jgi:hypothetical protein
VFTARYALSPYIKQIRFFFKGLILHRSCPCDGLGLNIVAIQYERRHGIVLVYEFNLFTICYSDGRILSWNFGLWQYVVGMSTKTLFSSPTSPPSSTVHKDRNTKFTAVTLPDVSFGLGSMIFFRLVIPDSLFIPLVSIWDSQRKRSKCILLSAAVGAAAVCRYSLLATCFRHSLGS